MSENEDLLIQWKITNILLARIYGALLSYTLDLDNVYVQKEMKKEIDIINKIINVFCGDVLDE